MPFLFIGVVDVVVVVNVIAVTTHTYYFVNIDTSGYRVWVYVVEYKREKQI